MMIGRGCFRFLRDVKHDAAEPLVKGPTAPMCDLDETTLERKADMAFAAYQAMRGAAASEPALLDNPYFIALQDTAYARFLLAFGALS